DVVPGLPAVTVHRDRLAAQHLPGEDRHHARLAVRILPRPVDVRVAERDEGQPVLGLVEERVELTRPLADAVRAERIGRMALGGGERLLLTVDGPARGDEDDAVDSGLARRL